MKNEGILRYEPSSRAAEQRKFSAFNFNKEKTEHPPRITGQNSGNFYKLEHLFSFSYPVLKMRFLSKAILPVFCYFHNLCRNIFLCIAFPFNLNYNSNTLHFWSSYD